MYLAAQLKRDRTSYCATPKRSNVLKQFVIASVAIFAFMLFADVEAHADVTGFFQVSADIIPQSTGVGSTAVQIDFTNELTFTLQLGPFGWRFHGHGGITGLEDIITSFFFAYGGFKIEPSIVIAQPFQLLFTSTGFPIPSCLPNAVGSGQCDLLFVSQRIDTSITFAGITIRNITLFEDTTFPDPTLPKPPNSAYSVQSQSFGFGDVISVEGQTTGGVVIHAATGICAQNSDKKLKKHDLMYAVNRDCAPGATTDLPFFFDFESLSITSIPLTPSLTASLAINCVTIFQCLFSNTISLMGGPVPLSASIVLDDLFTLDVQSLSVTLTQGPGSLTVQLGSAGAISMSSINLSFLINPDTNPGRLNLFLSGAPGVGINDLTASFSVNRLGLTTKGSARFTGTAGSFDLSSFAVESTAQIGVVNLFVRGSFSMHGLELLRFRASVTF